MKTLSFLFCFWVALSTGFAQTRLPVIHSGTYNATITDGRHVKTEWHLDPKAKPDIYYVNIPRIKNKVTFHTDKASLNFDTRFGQDYDFLIVVNDKDTCHIRISAKDEPAVIRAASDQPYPDTIPFSLKGSRVYLAGKLNGERPVTIQFDLGAGGTVVNKAVSGKLALQFDSKTSISNTQGTAEARTSSGNTLEIGSLRWQSLPFTEVSNMKPDEDIIIGNGLFRDKIIELDYDRKLMIVSEKLPKKSKDYTVQPVFYEQNRPKFEVTIRHNDQPFSFWFLFDTGRDGTMLIGKDFTEENDNWSKLQPLTTLGDGRKIVRLDATIGGQEFKDIVTNAADPGNAASRPTLFGNQVLNHFNMILDNQKGLLYLKPNGRKNEPYANYDEYLKTLKK
ncbi:MAG: hypothetical protein JWQ34_2561 [Mucilaginibacter sp.]|uniref:retropepsin-like aspartic protease n=1 Tax=Mucilaginibacter sp. TaxID=1882438 RepID=UPI00263985D3|nr:retropepsin-like aspartic protease [Mucilaginibacter sp.]MDB5004336.1 hypothetical protein [Mucilaginibacter sp.]